MAPALRTLSLAAALAASVGSQVPEAAAPARPNVVVIVSDDAGHADFGMQGSAVIRTPHIDSIAKAGVRCTQGYVTASVCSPSRAGLMTGRYQQRFGHEFNIPPRMSEENGLPLDEQMLPAVMKQLGYRTIGLGKWHLGYAPKFHPRSRGFDHWFGFLQGARSYRPLPKPTALNQLLRDREPQLPEQFDYMTDELGRQAAGYVDRHHHAEPFFLYLSFNAVHTPMHARDDDLANVPDGVGNDRRRKLVAMTVAMDRAVGVVLDALRRNGVFDDTLVVFVNDNGGARTNASSNQPLRGKKGSPFEGGIRIPFALQWPARLPKGVTYDHPVSTLDILPTAVAAAGGGSDWRAEKPLDGVDLLPFLSGQRDGRPHPTLYWRKGPNFAIRDGDWKLLRQGAEGPWLLFDLAADAGEASDLAADRPELVAKLRAKLDAWNGELAEPRWRAGSGRRRRR